MKIATSLRSAWHDLFRLAHKNVLPLLALKKNFTEKYSKKLLIRDFWLRIEQCKNANNLATYSDKSIQSFEESVTKLARTKNSSLIGKSLVWCGRSSYQFGRCSVRFQKRPRIRKMSILTRKWYYLICGVRGLIYFEGHRAVIGDKVDVMTLTPFWHHTPKLGYLNRVARLEEAPAVACSPNTT